MAQRSVLLVTEELVTVNAVTSAMLSNGQLAHEDICRDLNEISARLTASPATAVLVDIDVQPGRKLGMLDSLVRRFPETRFVVLAREMDPRLMLEAMQAGARHFLTKAEIPTSLSDVLQRLSRSTNTNSGQVISIYSASGGCGATSIAVNLAWELQNVSARPAMLIDLDYAYGGISAYLGLEGTYGVMDLQERSGSIDPELIATSTVSYNEQLKVLVSAAPSRLGLPGGYSRLRDTLYACAATTSMLVVDAPRLPPDTAAELARISTTNLLVLQLNVKDVRATRSLLGVMRARGISSDAFILLINRYRRRTAHLDIEEARRALGDVHIQFIANDFPSASESINFGQPLEKAAPRSVLRKDIQQLAAKLLSTAASVNGVHK